MGSKPKDVSSTEEETWSCECGYINFKDKSKCHRCDKDRNSTLCEDCGHKEDLHGEGICYHPDCFRFIFTDVLQSGQVA